MSNLLSLVLYVGEGSRRWKHALEFAPNACPVLNANAEAPFHSPNPDLALPTLSFAKKKETRRYSKADYNGVCGMRPCFGTQVS